MIHRDPIRFPEGAPRVTWAMLFLLITVQLFGWGIALWGISPGQILGFEREAILSGEIWRVCTFAFSTFAPTSPEHSNAALLASFLLFALSFATLVVSGRECEKYLGSLRFAGLIFTVVLLQAALSVSTLELANAWSPVAFSLSLLVFSLVLTMRDPDYRQELANDARVFLMLFPLMLALFSGALDPAFRPLLVCVAAGPIVAIAALAMRPVHPEDLEGEESETPEPQELPQLRMRLVDEFLVMNDEEIRAETDLLLDRISAKGIASLDEEEKEALAFASQRLAAIKSSTPHSSE